MKGAAGTSATGLCKPVRASKNSESWRPKSLFHFSPLGTINLHLEFSKAMMILWFVFLVNISLALCLVAQSCPTLCDSMHGLHLARLLCSWDSPGKNTVVGCHALLQGIFPTQGSNPGLLHCRQILYHSSYLGSPALYFNSNQWFPPTVFMGNSKRTPEKLQVKRNRLSLSSKLLWAAHALYCFLNSW